MKILAIEKEYAGKTAEDLQTYLEREAMRVWELQMKESFVKYISEQTEQVQS